MILFLSPNVFVFVFPGCIFRISPWKIVQVHGTNNCEAQSLFWNSQGTCNKTSKRVTNHMLKLLASKTHTRSVQGIDRLQINSNTGYSVSPVAVDHKAFSHGRSGQGRVRAAVLVGVRKAKYKTSWAPYTWRYTGVQVGHLPRNELFSLLDLSFSLSLTQTFSLPTLHLL